ncbi:MAG: cytochrome d ubiquinol oxidase subunit II [Nitrospira sp.]|nr:cytochrome d ubiquinol oxidase subunit II [Nitrospira sp.]
METLWFAIVALMLAIYVVLDGFDFGTGIVYLFVACTDAERRTALQAIEPVWDGNEVWLIASGGLLFMAFPRVYAAGFSGFYLALMLVLWLLILRGIALPMRSHLANPLWRTFWDCIFAGASLLLAIVLGAALGNLIRGVPLNAEGYFFAALWTDFLPGPVPGILDWYTLLMGLEGAAILAVHGANYLAMKTDGPVRDRAGRIATLGLWAVLALTVASLMAIPFVQPGLRRNYDAHPIGYVLPVLVLGTLASLFYWRRRQQDGASFLASSLLIFGLLGSTAWGLYPNLLISTVHPTHSLTVSNAAASPEGLRTALGWFLVGFSLVVAYSLYVYRCFRGKVVLSKDERPGM